MEVKSKRSDFLGHKNFCFSNKNKSERTCSVIILILLPLFAKSYASLFVGVTYAAFVLPTLVSANSKYPPTPLKHLMHPLLEGGEALMKGTKNLFLNLYAPIERTELALFSIPNIFTMMGQMTFFKCCDHLLLSEHKISSLYTLIFYNVITYCISYIKELIEKDNWTLSVPVSSTCSLKHLSMTATKLVLEWTKAITFLITLVFMLLVFTLEQALDKYVPTKTYLLLTFLYYASTEKLFVSIFPKLLTKLDMACFDALEEFWSPVLLKLFTISLASLTSLALLMNGQYRSVLINLYINVYLINKYMNIYHIPKLQHERNILKEFRFVTKQELITWNDICPICLYNMNVCRARITQCAHVFHSECLRKYLKVFQNNVCPLCKKVLIS